MKTVTRLMLIPVLLAQITFSPKAEAKKLEWWEAALVGVAAGVITYAVLSHEDESNMDTAMRGTFRGRLRVGDRVDWRGDRHRGHYVFDAEGSSADGRYNNCRRVRPVIYNEYNQEVPSQRQPTCACQTADNRWKVIPEGQFVPRQEQYGPYLPQNTYEQNSPYSPFYSNNEYTNPTRPMVPRYRESYPYTYPVDTMPTNYRPTPYYPPQHNNNDDFSAQFGLRINL